MLAGSYRPAWSPDGRKIAFDSSRALDGSDAANLNDVQNIWAVNVDGSGATPLTQLTAAKFDSTAQSFAPVWSADGLKIAFTSSRALDGSNAASKAYNVWMMNANGSGVTPVTKLTAISAVTAVWSADGLKIAFESPRALDGSDAVNLNDVQNIWMVSVDGSGATPLTTLTAAGADSREPAWQP